MDFPKEKPFRELSEKSAKSSLQARDLAESTALALLGEDQAGQHGQRQWPPGGGSGGQSHGMKQLVGKAGMKKVTENWLARDCFRATFVHH